MLRLLDPATNPFPDAPPRRLRTRLVAFSWNSEAGKEGQAYWQTVDLPARGRWDTSSLCLEMSGEGSCVADRRAGVAGGIEMR